MSTMWNLWHGCTKVSAGCKHCYVYRRDAEFGKDSSIVTKTKAFDLPIRKNRKTAWSIPASPRISSIRMQTNGEKMPGR